MPDSLDIKTWVMTYLRYERQFHLVCTEVEAHGDRSDILAVDKKGLLWEVEVKISLGDLKNDKKKNIHRRAANLLAQPRDGLFRGEVAYSWKLPARFYFAVPSELRDEALKVLSEHYPYAGLLSVSGGIVSAPRRAEALHERILDQHQCWELVKHQSGTLVRAMQVLVRRKSTEVAA